MNENNFDIERMRKAWREMGQALGMDTPPNDNGNMNDMKTALDRLRDRYRLGCDWSIVGAVVFAILFLFWPWIDDEYRIPLTIISIVAMSANACVLYWFWQGLGKINPLTMSITEVSSMAKYYRRCYLRYNIIGFPIALLWVGYSAYATNRHIDSIVTGFIIGGIFGLYGLWKDLKDYRNLTK